MSIKTNLTEERIERHYREGSWLGLTFPDLLKKAASAFPDKTFIIDSNKEITYGQFDLMVRRLALHFLRLEIKKETLVSVQLPSSIEYFVVLMALMMIGAIHMPLPPRIGREDLEHLTSLCSPEISVITHEFGKTEYLPIYKALRLKLPELKTILVSSGETESCGEGILSLNRLLDEPVEKDYPDDYLEKFRPSPTDLCLVQLTSGTTGLPKGAMHNQETCISGPILSYQIAGRPDDIFLCLSPAFHTAGTTVFTLALYYKCPMIIMDRFRAERSLELIDQKGVTALFGVPTHYADMLNVPDLENYNLESLRFTLSTGALMPPTLASKTERGMGCRLHIYYASTETKASGTFVLLTEQREEIRYHTLGKPTPYTRIKVVDDRGREVPQGKPGEILIRGPGNFVGYYNDPKLTEESLDEDGFFRTGDLGAFDKWGNLRMTGRKKDMIIRGGENIYPKEIEDTLLKHPKIKDAAVIGAPNERLGEIVCACIVPKAKEMITLEDVVSFLHGKIETHSLPEMLKIMDNLPRTESGKMLKSKIKEEIEKG